MKKVGAFSPMPLLLGLTCVAEPPIVWSAPAPGLIHPIGSAPAVIERNFKNKLSIDSLKNVNSKN